MVEQHLTICTYDMRKLGAWRIVMIGGLSEL
jgi:hypothetical protein